MKSENRTEWEPLESNNPGLASSLLSRLLARVDGDGDSEAVVHGKSFGKSSQTEMESELAAIDGVKSSVPGETESTLHRQREERSRPRGAGVGIFQPADQDAGGFNAATQAPRRHLATKLTKGRSS